MQQTQYNLRWATLALLALLLLGCDQSNQGNTATISIRMAGSSADQSSGTVNTREAHGNAPVDRVVITVTNFTSGDVIASGEMAVPGGSLSLRVPAHTTMLLTGQGFAGGILAAEGETNVPALRPGESDNPTLVLTDVGTNPKPPIGTTLTGFVSPGFDNNSDIKLIEVDNFGNQVGATPIAQAPLDIEGGFSITVPLGILPGSKYIFRATDDPNGDPPAVVDARYSNNNVDIPNKSLTINKQTNAVSDIITVLTRDGNIQDISTEITLAEMSEVEQVVGVINQFLDQTNTITPQDYSNAVLASVNANLEYRNITSSIVAQGHLCGKVQLDIPDISITPVSGIRIQVRDFDSQIIRARTFTDANGDYCLDVPNQNEINVLTGAVDSNGEYIVGAMNYTGMSSAGSAWWVKNEMIDLNPIITMPLRVDAAKLVLPDPTLGFGEEALTNPNTVMANFLLRKGVIITGNVSGVSEGPIPLSDITIIVRDSRTYFLTAVAKTDTNGDYQLNVTPGDYIIEAVNTTPVESIQASQPYASAALVTSGVNPTGTNKRNFAAVLSPSGGDAINQYDFMLDFGVRVNGRITEPTDGGPIPVTGERVVFNLRAQNQGDGPSTRLRTKNTDGSFGIWLRPDNYQVFAYGQNQNADITQPRAANAFVLADFAAQVAKLPINVRGIVAGQNIQLSQIKFELFEKPSTVVAPVAARLMHTGFSRSDGSVMLYSQSALPHVVVGTIDQGISQQRPYTSAVYGGTGQGFTQRDIGLPIPLTPGVMAPPIVFDPPQLGGTLRGRVTQTINGAVTPVANLRVRVFHRVSNAPSHPSGRFVQTRTRSDGSYELSLPQATYTKVVFSDTSVANGQPITCDYVPVFQTITTLGINYDLVDPCVRSAIPSPFVKVGNAYFDTTKSADLTQHPLYSNPTEDWNMMSATGSLLDYTFNLAPTLVSNVNTTIRDRTQFGGEVIETEALAIDIGGGLFSLGSSFGAALVPYTNPVLLIPGELATGVTWNIFDGNLTAPVLLKLGEIVSFEQDSAGQPATNYVHVSYTQNIQQPPPQPLPIVEDYYYEKLQGLQQEIITDTNTVPSTILGDWKRTVILPVGLGGIP